MDNTADTNIDKNSKPVTQENPENNRQMNAQARFLKPDFLAVYVALIALVLSQLPPLYTITQKPKLKIDFSDYVVITHLLGRTSTLVPISISNTGNGSSLISKVDCSLTTATGSVISFVASDYATYQPVPGVSQSTVFRPIGSVLLKSDERWTEVISCVELPTSGELELASNIVGEWTDYFALITQRPDFNPQQRYEFPPESVQRATDAMRDRFGLEVGEYTITIRLSDEDGKTILEQSSKLIISQSDVDRLLSHSEQYKFGIGINFPVPNHLTVTAPLMKDL